MNILIRSLQNATGDPGSTSTTYWHYRFTSFWINGYCWCHWWHHTFFWFDKIDFWWLEFLLAVMFLRFSNISPEHPSHSQKQDYWNHPFHHWTRCQSSFLFMGKHSVFREYFRQISFRCRTHSFNFWAKPKVHCRCHWNQLTLICLIYHIRTQNEVLYDFTRVNSNIPSFIYRRDM